MSKKQIEANYRKYFDLCHAMQSGVKFTLDIEAPGHENGLPGSASHKHLRVGINAAMSDHGALVALLFEKGIITELEYSAKLVEWMQREVDKYQKELSAKLGKNVTLA